MSDSKPKTKSDPARFWSWFAAHELELREIVSGQRAGRVTELIDAALADANVLVSYDLTEGARGGEITFSPEGDPEAAVFVDAFVAKAPALEHWTIHRRRQRKSLNAALAFTKAIHDVDLTGCHFLVRYLEDRFHLCFLHPGLSALPEERRFAVAATFLDHALGEEISMAWIGHIEFRPSGEGIEMGLMVNQIIREAEGEVLPSTVVSGGS